MHKTLTSVILAVATLMSAPVGAQTWRPTAHASGEIRQDINQLDHQISRAERRGTINRREASILRREASDARRQYAQFRSNGLSRAEVSTLERIVNEIRRELRLANRDWDGRR